MKIKFVSPEYANFTGMFGSVEFDDGVSVHDVSTADARLFSAITTIELVGENVVTEATYEGSKDVSAVSFNLPTLAELQAAEAAGAPVTETTPVASAALYTKEELEEVADKKGISGLREIGEPLNVRGTSIAKLIDAILDAQAPKPTADAGFIEAPADAVSVTLIDADLPATDAEVKGE